MCSHSIFRTVLLIFTILLAYLLFTFITSNLTESATHVADLFLEQCNYMNFTFFIESYLLTFNKSYISESATCNDGQISNQISFDKSQIISPPNRNHETKSQITNLNFSNQIKSFSSKSQIKSNHFW